MTPETELIASQQAAAAGDIESANKRWAEFVRLLFLKMKAAGLPVQWIKKIS